MEEDTSNSANLHNDSKSKLFSGKNKIQKLELTQEKVEDSIICQKENRSHEFENINIELSNPNNKLASDSNDIQK